LTKLAQVKSTVEGILGLFLQLLQYPPEHHVAIKPETYEAVVAAMALPSGARVLDEQHTQRIGQTRSQIKIKCFTVGIMCHIRFRIFSIIRASNQVRRLSSKSLLLRTQLRVRKADYHPGDRPASESIHVSRDLR
jgi:hypothetical protein